MNFILRIGAVIGTSLMLAEGALCGPSTLLHDVRVIDGNGGIPLEHADILIDGDRIASIGPALPKGRAPGARVVDLKGMTALPGLISNHSHVGMVDGVSVGAGNASQKNILRQLRQYEAYGVTTVTSLGLNQKSFYELQPRLHTGELPGADIFGADRGFGVTGGAPPAGMGISDGQVYRPRTADDAREEVRESSKRHPDLLKLWLDDFHGTVSVKMDAAVYKAIIDEAHAHHLRVAAHVFYLEDAKRLVGDGIDILAHGVRDQPVDDDLIAAMKARQVWYIPTLGLDEAFYLFAEHPELANQPLLHQALQPAVAAEFADASWRSKVLTDTKKVNQDKQALQFNERNIKTLYDAGILIGFGTDSGAMPLRIAGFAEHHELALLTQAGLTPLQAIGCATKSAARLLELHDRGVLEPGKLADLVIVEGNPAVNIADMDRIAAVWHRGKQVAGSLTGFSP